MAIKIYVDQVSANGKIAFVKNAELAQYDLMRLNHSELGKPTLFTAGCYIVAVFSTSTGWIDLIFFRISPSDRLTSELKELGFENELTGIIPRICDSTVTSILPRMEQYILKNYNELANEIEIVVGWPDKPECRRYCGVGPVMFFTSGP